MGKPFGISILSPCEEQLLAGIINTFLTTNNKLRDFKVIGTLDIPAGHWTFQRMLNIVVKEDDKFIPIVEEYFKEFEGTLCEYKLFSSL
jgi:hypothetical protein